MFAILNEATDLVLWMPLFLLLIFCGSYLSFRTRPS